MPGLCRPIREGGIGFDYRLGMAIPDYWIRVLKEEKDEEWSIGKMWDIMTNRLPKVKTIAYSESHDQALVGDQTIAFRLMQSEIYFKMSKHDESAVVDRGIALHKMIRLCTLALGGQAYLNFIGNEFGHPDWIDFPREGNNWSFQYARRQWSLIENKELKYHYLAEFDKEMLSLVKSFKLFDVVYAELIQMDEVNKTMVFERQGLIFLFNFHIARSVPDYSFPVSEPGDYHVMLNSDDPAYGGHGRIDSKIIHISRYSETDQTHRLSVYNTNRTVQVFHRLA